MILLTGATGYVGGRLLKSLEAVGRPVRCFARSARHPQVSTTEWVQGDILDEPSVRRAAEGCCAAVYLIHSMKDEGFQERDRRAAGIFARAVQNARMERLVFLGGLGRGPGLSAHLESRHEVGRILRGAGVPATDFRASVILGSGSLSFELIRSLVDKLPVMVTPRWVSMQAQPIAIDDVVGYLVEALTARPPREGIFEIGGRDRVSYGGLMREYARQEGLHRLLIPVPVLSTTVSSLWLSLVAPVQAKIGKALIEGLRNETVVTDDAAERAFDVRPMGVQEATRIAREGKSRPKDALAGWRSVTALGACLAATLSASALGGVATSMSLGPWYESLRKPSWTPPGSVFGPVWTILYVMMAVSAWLIWKKEGLREARLSLGMFGLQLALNAAWSWLFFASRSPGAGLIGILPLWVAIGTTVLLFSARSGWAAALMVPYWAWVTFAAALNLEIWRMN